MKLLVCGGAGYIGSHMVKMLSNMGHDVVTFDNLSTGFRTSVKWGAFVEGDLLNQDDLDALFSIHRFDAVVHFAARSLVGESEKKPELYYHNNVDGTRNLLDAMVKHGVSKIIFSSTAAIYGNPEMDAINELHPKNPINVYGKSKLMVEEMLVRYAHTYGINSVALRYFNAAGADPQGDVGEKHDPETHLIPNILKSLLGDGSNGLKVFGNNYDTHDGTCVRDYIHVNDLCRAHVFAIDYLHNHQGAFAFNLGNGKGFSVMQVIRSAEMVTETGIEFEIHDRRPGDPAILVADASLSHAELGWEPEYQDIVKIIQTAWRWHQKVDQT